jgi:putative ABC transport system permease protein
MTSFVFLTRSLRWYGRTNLAILAGAAIATAVLCGALLTGHSVRVSLHQLAVGRLGATEQALISRNFFPADLAAAFHDPFRSTALIALEGAAVHQRSNFRVNRVAIFGVDDSFYSFHGAPGRSPRARGIALSPALAREMDARKGDTVLLRFEEPSSIPREFLQGRREDVARTLRFVVQDPVVPPVQPEFSLAPSQGELRAVYVSREFLGSELKQEDRANTILLAGGGAEAAVVRLQERFRLEDLGLTVRHLGDGGYALEHRSTLIDDRTADRALRLGKSLGLLQRPLITYLANSIRIGRRDVPYSLVAGADEATLAELNGDRPLANVDGPPLLLNQWAVDDLGARIGDEVELDYFLWSGAGELATATAKFAVAGVVPMRGLGADPTVAPDYPGITDQASVGSWDPPFPVELKRIRQRDEDYWDRYRTTPKAWIPLDVARRIWDSRYGSLTSIRYAEEPVELARALRAELDPLAGTFTLLDVRRQAVESAFGSTDFGEYFLYFSFFVMVSALFLMGLFFRLSIEQRQREVGLLHALGFNQRQVRALLLQEGLVLAAAGTALGIPLGLGYAWLVLHGLRTWWIGATRTTLITLAIDPTLLAAGAAAGLAVAVLAIWWTLRGWRDLTPRGLMAGPGKQRAGRISVWTPLLTFALALVALVPAALGVLPAALGFFLGGTLLLAAFLTGVGLILRRPFVRIPPEPGWRPALALAARNAAWRPGRSVLAVALIASAAFLLVSLEAFRHGEERDPARKDSGTGGFTMYAESQAPLIHDPNSETGRAALNLDILPEMTWTPFRLRPGDDVSCLNLYQPRNPRILGAPAPFLREGRFRFAASLAASPEAEANPWLLLEGQLDRGIIPAIADANSLQYVLHKKIGDLIRIEREGAEPITLKLVASLRSSVFQSELIISEKDFLRLFPSVEGARVFLIEGPPETAQEVEDALGDHAMIVERTERRLADFHQVDNTYISTFQALGSLGLLLGTFGLAAVLLRNALERRRELALLRAAGYGRSDVGRLLLFENLALLGVGLVAGATCALIAIGPALVERGSLVPLAPVSGIVVLIFAGGAVATKMAVRAALHAPLMESLRTE